MALTSRGQKQRAPLCSRPPPSSRPPALPSSRARHSLTCGFIPVKPEEVIKHNEDLCRAIQLVSARKRPSQPQRGRSVASRLVLLVCVCVRVRVYPSRPSHLPAGKSRRPAGRARLAGNTLPLCSICSKHTPPHQSLTRYPCREPITRRQRRSCGTPEAAGSPFVIYS